MRRRKCIYITILILFLLFVAGSVYYYLPKDPSKQPVRYEIRSQYGGGTLEEIEWMGGAPDGISVCLVQYGKRPSYYPIVPGKYIVYEDLDAYTRDVYRGDEYIGYDHLYNEYILYRYDITTKERTNLYDMNELAGLFPGIEFGSSCGIYQWDGQDVWITDIGTMTDADEDADYNGYLYINVEDGSYEFHDKLPKRIVDSAISDIIYWTDYDIIEENFQLECLEEMYINEYKNYEGIYEINYPAQYLPQNNETLYTMFPELEQYRGEEDCYVYMLIGGDPSAEELLRLLMEDDQEISFEGAVLSAEQSVDGEKHEIHSFEDFERWFADEE